MTEYVVKIIKPGKGNPPYWYNDKVGQEFICVKEKVTIIDPDWPKKDVFKTIERKNEKHFPSKGQMTQAGYIQIEDGQIISERIIDEETKEATQLQNLCLSIN